MNRSRAVESFGWYGALAILVAYVLVSFGLLVPTSTEYQVLNLSGALGLVSAAYSKKDYPPMVLNIVWVLIALFAVVRIILR